MDGSMTEERSGPWPRLLAVAALVTAAAAGYAFLGDLLSFEALATHRAALVAFRDAHFVLTAAGFVLAYVAIVALSLPGATVATLAGGFLFGLFPGALFNVVGATVGATLVFLAARWGLGAALSRRIDASEGRVKRLRAGLRENELSFLLLMRLVPAVPFFVANIVPALVGVGTGRFVVTTFFGIIPGAIVYTWVGAGLGEVFARGARPDLGIIFAPHVLGPILGLCALALLPVAMKALRRRGRG
jgi:uncharacterized membrane protein YdjX (TVP38/TMEM64 family)